MKRIMCFAVISISLATSGCMSIEGINEKLSPLNSWYEREYEETRFTQRYQFTKTDADTVKKEIVKLLPDIGLSITSEANNNIVANGYPTSMFSTEECEAWKNADEARTQELSGGLLGITCDPSSKTSIIIATIGIKPIKHGTLVVLDYEVSAPQLASYGVHGPRRPPPTASKAGSTKFWEMLNKRLPLPIRQATKEDVS